MQQNVLSSSSCVGYFLLLSNVCSYGGQVREVDLDQPAQIRERTFPVFACTTHRVTVTVAVLRIAPTLVTRPMNDMGGIFRCSSL